MLLSLTDLKERKTAWRMTIGIDPGDRKSHFCVLNDEAQVIARGFLPTTITALVQFWYSDDAKAKERILESAQML